MITIRAIALRSEKRLDEGLRWQLLRQNPQFLWSYTFNVVGKNLNGGAHVPLVVNIN